MSNYVQSQFVLSRKLNSCILLTHTLFQLFKKNQTKLTNALTNKLRTAEKKTKKVKRLNYKCHKY